MSTRKKFVGKSHALTRKNRKKVKEIINLTVFPVSKSKPNIVWITLINKGYVNFTKNFIESMKRNDCIFPLIVYCTDNDSMTALKHYSNITCIDASPFLKHKFSEKFSKYGQMEYKYICFAKLDAIKFALTQYKDSYIGYIDTDIIVLKNPEKTIMNAFTLNPKAVFVSQCDENRLHCSNLQNCPNICAGLIIFKNISIVNKLLNYTDHHVKTMRNNDQEFIQKIANKYKIKHVTIKKNIFLNGVFPGVNNDALLKLPSTAELVHFNYLKGNQKIVQMKKNKMWYI
jgi:hypothetical protein